MTPTFVIRIIFNLKESSRPREASNAQPLNNGFSPRPKVVHHYSNIFGSEIPLKILDFANSASLLRNWTPAFLVSFLANSDCNKDFAILYNSILHGVHPFIDFTHRTTRDVENTNYPNYLIAKSRDLLRLRMFTT